MLTNKTLNRHHLPLLSLLPAEYHQVASKQLTGAKQTLKWLDQDFFSSQTG
jgi:hypothetical protein